MYTYQLRIYDEKVGRDAKECGLIYKRLWQYVRKHLKYVENQLDKPCRKLSIFDRSLEANTWLIGTYSIGHVSYNIFLAC